MSRTKDENCLYRSKEFIKFCKNHTVNEIAEKYGLGKTHVRSVIQHYKISYKHRKKESTSIDYTSEEFLNFCKDHTAAEIANKYGITKPQFYNIVQVNRYHGFKDIIYKKVKNKELPEVDPDELFKMIKELPTKEIMEKLDIKRSSVLNDVCIKVLGKSINVIRKEAERERYNKSSRVRSNNYTMEQMIAYLGTKFSPESISNAFNLSLSYVRHTLLEFPNEPKK